MTRPLDGIHTLVLSNTLSSANIAQFLADFGAEVAVVEPPGGSPLRAHPAFPFWARGTRSIVLDFGDTADLAVARSLARRSDVVVETFRPGVAERLGLGYHDLSGDAPGLVYASISGFGRTGPWAHLKGYEGVVMAKIGAYDSFGAMATRDGPAFCAAPYCSWSAAHAALHGILTALVEREGSGLGQWVETDLVRGLSAHDTWNWLLTHMVSQYPDAFLGGRPSERGATVPSTPLMLRLLIALSADGRWLQFSQTTPRLFQAFMEMLELDWMFDDPKWKSVPDFDDLDQRAEYYEMMLAKVRTKTVAEWQAEFDAHPDVWAEIFRHGTELLDHPQMQHDGDVIEVEHPGYGVVRQPGPMVRLAVTPGNGTGAVPALDEHGAALRARAAAPVEPPAPAPAGGPTGLPLEGVTVLELGTYFAAPFGATVLTDLGARVIKAEQLDGDPIRWILPFPEAGAVRAVQGKESVAVDLARDEGREIIHAIARRADLVLLSFRAGVAERLGVDAASLLAVNPDLMFLNSPGYGVDGPCGHRPAFAPTIGAGSGLAWRNIGSAVPERPDLTMMEIRLHALRMGTAAMGVGHADGFGALGVGSALLLGLLAKRRGAPGQALRTSMLLTLANVLGEDMFEYPGRAPIPTTDPDLHGLSACYRLYETADGWVFLAAPTAHEWSALARALAPHVSLADDARFATADARREHDDELVAALTAVFATRPAADWEHDLTADDVACVAVAPGSPDANITREGGFGREHGWVVEVEHPVLGVHPRYTALFGMSRSATQALPGCTLGQHTDRVLHELGYDDERIADLREAGVIG